VPAERHVITIGHSYVVAENRRLAHEMALAGRGRWKVTAIAPSAFHADLGPIALEAIANEADTLVPLGVRWDRRPHFMTYRRLRRALSAPADLVHCWEEPYVRAAAQVARLAPMSARVIYATFQNLPKRYPWPLSRYERESLARASGWIAFGHTAARTLEQRAGYASRPYRIVPPGVDVDRFRPNPAEGTRIRREIGWTESAAVVGFLGRFTPEKGIADLCAALEQMRAPWHALFIGGGALEPDLRRFAAAHLGRVHIATGVRHSDVPAWLNAMTLLCAPSRTTTRWREQFGRMLIESMACGVPVVASDSGEMPEVVQDAGRILPERRPAAWADALDALLDDAAARQALGRAGVDRARATFAWRVVAQQHLEFFETMLETSERG